MSADKERIAELEKEVAAKELQITALCDHAEEYSERLLELKRKLAEQQAGGKIVAWRVGTLVYTDYFYAVATAQANMLPIEELVLRGGNELNNLLAKAKEEGRREAVTTDTNEKPADGRSASNGELATPTQKRGHYFEFKRGEWIQEWKNDGWYPAEHYEASGTRYVGNLTKCQRDQLDALINDFLKNREAVANIAMLTSAPKPQGETK